jgi:hypothetical protein
MRAAELQPRESPSPAFAYQHSYRFVHGWPHALRLYVRGHSGSSLGFGVVHSRCASLRASSPPQPPRRNTTASCIVRVRMGAPSAKSVPMRSPSFALRYGLAGVPGSRSRRHPRHGDTTSSVHGRGLEPLRFYPAEPKGGTGQRDHRESSDLGALEGAGSHQETPVDGIAGRSRGDEGAPASPRGTALANLYADAARLAGAGDIEGARALHEAISRLLGVAGAGDATVVDLASRKRGGR